MLIPSPFPVSFHYIVPCSEIKPGRDSFDQQVPFFMGLSVVHTLAWLRLAGLFGEIGCTKRRQVQAGSEGGDFEACLGGGLSELREEAQNTWDLGGRFKAIGGITF